MSGAERGDEKKGGAGRGGAAQLLTRRSTPGNPTESRRASRQHRGTPQTLAVVRSTLTYCGPARGTGHLSKPVRALLAQTGGIVSTRELRAVGVDPTMLELYRDYGSLQAVRQGWHCHPDVSPLHRLAWRFGGPLACVSALEFHASANTQSGLSDAIDTPLHICVPGNTRSVPSPHLLAERWSIPIALQPVVHWSTRDSRSGNRLAVSRSVALRQADRCTAI
jgi:hypothetical protein